MYNNTNLERYLYQCYRPDYRIAILKCKCCISFFGVFDVQVLYGRTVSRGYEFEPGAYAEERFINIAAPYAIGPPAQFDSLPDHGDHSINFHRVKWRLNELTNAVDSILEEFDAGDSILLFRFNFSKICACIRELYGQVFFTPPDSINCYRVGPLCNALLVKCPSLYEGSTANSVMQLIELVTAKSREGERSITMIVGNKSTGKSMLARLVANSLLGKSRPPVYILDCDVGQPEMNPPGCVSLLKLNSPLLGVPMFQQRISFADTYFYGRILLNADIKSYLLLLRKLLQRFRNDSAPCSALLISTLGWVEGKGAAVLDEMTKLFDPDFVFSFTTPFGPNYKVKQSLTNKSTKPVMLFGDAIQKPMHMISVPLTLRNLRITGYMVHACPAPTVKSFANATPFAVPFREIAIQMHTNEPFPINHIFAVLNCTLVALCVRDHAFHSKMEKRLFDDEEMPVLLNPNDEGPLRTVGYGFIRAIDLERHIFYVVTPLKISALQEVNVFARGLNIDLPRYFLVSQAKPAVPYVVQNQSSSFHSELFRELRIKTVFHRKRFLRMRNRFVRKKVVRNSEPKLDFRPPF